MTELINFLIVVVAIGQYVFGKAHRTVPKKELILPYANLKHE